jgi:D-alanyl-D-alanine carboxypeptidase
MTSRKAKRLTLVIFKITGLLLLVLVFGSYFLYRSGYPSQVLSLQSTASIPISKNAFSFPLVSAKYIFILDRTSKTVLYQKEATKKIYPASTTKMVSAIVALEHFPLTQIIQISKTYSEGQILGLLPGQRLSVQQLLYGLLVQSANDSAEVLAENYPGGRTAFVSVMNDKVKEWGVTDTHFVNPSGLDENNHYSTALDLVKIADLAMKYADFAKIVATETAVLDSGANNHLLVLKNVNELLGKVPGVMGVKTGFTTGAGQSLISLVGRNGHEVLFAVLGSTDRFDDTRKLIDWVFTNFEWP